MRVLGKIKHTVLSPSKGHKLAILLINEIFHFIALKQSYDSTISEEISAKICKLSELQNPWEEGE
ncbi:hypothetical protein DPV78_006790 [Talaromyces pinophilus]|nr:hypothetical protein DPV78_006790 [Talaromyces pinophilus]